MQLLNGSIYSKTSNLKIVSLQYTVLIYVPVYRLNAIENHVHLKHKDINLIVGGHMLKCSYYWRLGSYRIKPS